MKDYYHQIGVLHPTEVRAVGPSETLGDRFCRAPKKSRPVAGDDVSSGPSDICPVVQKLSGISAH